MEYPYTPKTETIERIHGENIPDPYRWLEEIDSLETRHWIEAQNRLTFAYLEAIPTRQMIYDRLSGLWDFEKFGIPIKHGGRYFFTRNDGLQNQSVLYWLESLGDVPKVLIDPNQLTEDGTIAMNNFTVSDDGNFLAYGLSSAGSDWQEWRVRNIVTGEDLPDRLRWVKFSTAAWTDDDAGFFYSRFDEPQEGQVLKDANYFQKLYYHHLGNLQEADELVYERSDQKEWGFWPQVSDDGCYLVITISVGSQENNAIFYKDLRDSGEVVPLITDFDASYNFIANQGTRFYFLTDLEAPNYRLISIDITQPERNKWQDVIPEAKDTLQSISLVGGRFFAIYMHDAHHLVKVHDQEGKPLGKVDLPGMGSVLGFAGKEKDSETFFLFTSFTTPDTVYHYEIVTGQSQIFRQPETDFHPDAYTIQQVFYNSKDGIRIPMYICHKADLKPEGNVPTILYGYGGFNIPQLPTFSVGALVWMEMGGIFALANLRGGGEYGQAWHQAGMLKNKQNVFDDFIAAAEWLIDQGYTCTPRLAIMGRSNGGLLVGACLTQRPDLFGAAIPVVGVLDMLRFHKFTIGWAWVSDYGSPEQADDFKTLLAYSPFHKVRPGTVYPPILITTGDHDDRVYPAHSYKFAAALQAAQVGSAPILIRVDTKAGHGMGKPTAKLLEENADQWAFLVKALGMRI